MVKMREPCRYLSGGYSAGTHPPYVETSSIHSRSSTSSMRSSQKLSYDDQFASRSHVAAEFAAHRANEAEVTMTLREGLRKYPKAIAWSMVISTVIIMEGFDTALLGTFMDIRLSRGNMESDMAMGTKSLRSGRRL